MIRFEPMDRVDLSIIVPIYNVENYLDDCLNSILKSGLSGGIEVLLINDGSNDSSASIAQSYCSKYPSLLSYFEQENKGLSEARNLGLRLSRGQYVLFLDSDDMLDMPALKKLLEKSLASGDDVVVGNFFHLFEGGQLQKNNSLLEAGTMGSRLWLERSLGEKKYLPAVWFKLYKRQFLLEHKLFFEPNLINEDQLFSLLVFTQANVVSAYNIPFYFYRHRDNSISRRFDVQSCVERIDSNIYITRRSLEIVRSLGRRKLEKYVMARTIKLLGDACQSLVSSGCSDDVVRQKLLQVNALKPARFIRVTRFSHVVDAVTLFLGIHVYLKWRELKW